jgi:hypothetical protein
MANFFDQFDAPATAAPRGNFFDQFDTPEAAPAAVAPAAPEPRVPAPENNVPGQITLPIIGKPSLIGLVKGIVEDAKQAAMLPGEVYAGRINPESPEGIKRAFSAATILSPTSRVPALAARTVKAPTTAEILDPTAAGYKTLTQEARAQPIAKEELGQIASDVKAHLNANGPRASTAPKTHAAIEEIKTPAVEGDVADLIDAKRNLRELLGGADKTEARAAMMAIDKIDAKLGELAPDLAPRLTRLDEDYAAAMKAGEVEASVANAIKEGENSGTGGNVGNKIRQAIKPLVTNAKKQREPKDPEIAAAERVTSPGPVANTLRALSAFDPTHSKLGMLLHMVTLVPSGGGSLVMAPVGMVSRMAYDRMMKSRAAQISELIRARSPMGQERGAGTHIGVLKLPVPAPLKNLPPLPLPSAVGLLPFLPTIAP